MRTVLAFMFVCLFSMSAQKVEAHGYGSPVFVQQSAFVVSPFGFQTTTFATGNSVQTFFTPTNAFFVPQSAFGFEVDRVRRPRPNIVRVNIGR